MGKLGVSVGITAYNEEANIGNLLDALLKQKLSNVVLKEIIVVASGCTDNTEEIVKNFIARDNRIKLISQPSREGKASAVNLFIKNAGCDVCVLESADTVPDVNTIEALTIPFLEPEVGMTGAHPMPVNDKKKFIGFAVHLLWELHHKLASISPKLGEMIAFRKNFEQIPEDSAVDEVSIETIITKKGLKLKYVPEAIVYNKGPETIKEFLGQRRRIYTGHLWSKKYYNYSPSSMDSFMIIKLLNRDSDLFRGQRPFRKKVAVPIWTFFTILLEVVSRFLGTYDFYVRHKNPFKWDIVKRSTIK